MVATGKYLAVENKKIYPVDGFPVLAQDKHFSMSSRKQAAGLTAGLPDFIMMPVSNPLFFSNI